MKTNGFSPTGVTQPDYNFHESESWNLQRQVLFSSYVTGPQGARFVLLVEKGHTPQDIEKAKQYLRTNHDVVSIKIEKEL